MGSFRLKPHKLSSIFGQHFDTQRPDFKIITKFPLHATFRANPVCMKTRYQPEVPLVDLE